MEGMNGSLVIFRHSVSLAMMWSRQLIGLEELWETELFFSIQTHISRFPRITYLLIFFNSSNELLSQLKLCNESTSVIQKWLILVFEALKLKMSKQILGECLCCGWVTKIPKRNYRICEECKKSCPNYFECERRTAKLAPAVQSTSGQVAVSGSALIW